MKEIIFLTVSALVYTITTTIIFYKKDIMNKLENRIFKKLLCASIASMLMELLIVFTTNLGVLGTIIQKTFLICLVLWLSIFLLYTFAITTFDDKKSEIENIMNFRIPHIIFIIVNIIIFVLIYTLPIEFVSISNDVKYTTGPSVNIVYIVFGIYVTIMSILIIKNIKSIHKKGYIPIIVLIVLMVISGIIQKTHPEILLTNALFGFVIYLMYHTIENPDMKMMEELSKNKRIIENQSEDTTNFLFRMTQDIKKPIKDLLEESRKTNTMDSRYINNKVRELDYTVNEVLDVSGMSTSSLKIYDNKYDIRNLLKEIRIKIENELPREIKLDYYVSRNVPKELFGDSIVLKRILISLLDNAIKHTKEGYISIEAEAIVKYDVARVMLSISDTGDGMSLDKINDILSHEISEEQYKVDSEKGIFNLNDVKHLMPILDGSIIIKSEEGIGSTVSITINQKIVPTEAREIAKKIEMYEESLNSGKRIIVVDDDAMELSRIKKMIEKKNNFCSTSLFGREVVEKVNKHYKYDLIILDDETDTHSAYTIFQELKKIKGFDTPVIIMIDDNKDFIKLHFLKEGFADVIMKSKINTEIERVLDKKY